MRKDGDLVLAMGVAVRFVMHKDAAIGCGQCHFLDENRLCSARFQTECIGGTFEHVPHEDLTDHQRTTLVTQALTR